MASVHYLALPLLHSSFAILALPMNATGEVQISAPCHMKVDYIWLCLVPLAQQVPQVQQVLHVPQVSQVSQVPQVPLATEALLAQAGGRVPAQGARSLIHGGFHATPRDVFRRCASVKIRKVWSGEGRLQEIRGWPPDPRAMKHTQLLRDQTRGLRHGPVGKLLGPGAICQLGFVDWRGL